MPAFVIGVACRLHCAATISRRNRPPRFPPKQGSSMRIALSFASALAAAALVASPALADNGKMYPGTSCIADNTYVDHAWGRAYNTSSNWNLYECPVIKDEIDYSIEWGRVWAIDQNLTAGYDVS